MFSKKIETKIVTGKKNWLNSIYLSTVQVGRRKSSFEKEFLSEDRALIKCISVYIDV